MTRSALFGAILAFGAAPCAADIYGYVDANGVAHWSNMPLSGYVLFKKEALRAPERATAPRVEAVEPTPRQAPTRVRVPALRERYAALVSRVAREQQLDAALLHAVITVESAYDERAQSPRGAMGLMQLMPATAQRYGVRDAWNPLENVRAGARYLKDLLALFNDNLNLALAAYNAGEGAVIGSGHRIPPYPETRNYVPRVLHHYEHYRSGARL
jgi:soluble lytic murein transglycosylase-like protein